MDSVGKSQAQQPSFLSTLWKDASTAVSAFFRGLSPTTWFGSKTTSLIGDFFNSGSVYGGMGHPCGSFVYIAPVKTPEYGKSYHYDAEPMSQQTAASAMRYAAAIGVTCGITLEGIDPRNLVYSQGLEYEGIESRCTPEDDFEYVTVTYSEIPGQEEEYEYVGNNVSINTKDLPGNITSSEKNGVQYYTDLDSGLTFTAIKDNKTGEIVVSFPGLGEGPSIPGIGIDKEGKPTPKNRENFNRAQLSAVTEQLAGGVPTCYKQAAAVVAQLKDKNPNATITTAGFSFGGSVAQYAALQYNANNPTSETPVKAHCFNGLAIGAGLQRAIGDETLEKADDYITHYGTAGDWVTDLKGMKTLDKILGFLGFRTPGNYGKKYILPPQDPGQGLGERHIGIFSNMLQHSGWVQKDEGAEDKKTV